MKLTLNESYKGEFDESHDKLADKLERGIDSLRHVCGFEKSGPKDGAVSGLDNLYEIMRVAHESRLADIKKIITDRLDG
mgnify:CR=1 FL=1